MPALQFQNLPAAQTGKIKNELHSQWQIEANALNKSWFPDRGKFNTAKAKLNAKYQQMELESLTKLQQQVDEQQRVQQLIKQGTQGIGREEEATLRMNLRPEAERLVFPEVEQPYSQSQLDSFVEKIKAYAGAAPSTPEFFTRRGKEPKTKKGIIGQYSRWREAIGYDNIAAKNPLRARQLDIQWDETMAEDPRYDKWWSNREKREPIVEIKALRTPGRMGKIMRGRITSAGGITPVGRSIVKEKPRVSVSPGGGRFPHTPTEVEQMFRSDTTIQETGFPYAPESATKQKPIRQRNTRTGQERISYDGGKTWQTIG